MSYRYFVTKRAPVAAWILDDDAPFLECTGSNLTGVLTTGTPTKSVPLVAGAGYSSVFKRGTVGRFACNLFQRGQENRAFALEAWVLPIRKTSGIEAVYGTSYRSSIMADDPVVYLPLNGGSQNVAGGVSFSGAVTYGSGMEGQGVSWSGNASEKLSTSTPITGSVLTLEIWHKHNPDVTNWKDAFASSTNDHHMIVQQGTTKLGMFVGSVTGPGGSGFKSSASANIITDSAWHHYVHVITAATASAAGTCKQYIDGVYVGTFDHGMNINTIGVERIGNWNSYPFQPFDEPAIYDYELSANRIAAHYAAGMAFNGDDPGAAWSGEPYNSDPYIVPSASEQEILSHSGRRDGLTINGSVVRFGTSYETTGDAFCDYDLGELKLAHVVGKHNADQNELWINGELVAQVDITDEQKNDVYAVDDQYLYTGDTVASQELAVNGVALYNSISGEDIERNYRAGIDFIGQDRVYPQYGGTPFDLSVDSGAVFLEENWRDRPAFESGLKNNVEYTDEKILPAYTEGVSLPGSWSVAVPLDAMEDTSIYGVMVSWSGIGITVDASLDGDTWAPVRSGRLVDIIPEDFDPTGTDLQVRVNFAGGSSNDTSYLESLRIVGYRNNIIENVSAREVSASHPAVLHRDFEPNLYRDDNGIYLAGGTLTIGQDPTTEPDPVRTLELWIKTLSGQPVISVGGTKYRNGATYTALTVGEWSLIHHVSSDDITSDITITGDCIVGQATLYPTALTQAEVTHIWKSYTGAAVLRMTDTNTVGLSEPSAPTSIYTHDWAIDAAG